MCDYSNSRLDFGNDPRTLRIQEFSNGIFTSEGYRGNFTNFADDSRNCWRILVIFLRLGCVIRKTTFSFGHGPEYDLDPGNFEGLLPVRYIGNAEFYLTRIMAEVFFLLVLLITEFESVIFVLCTTVPCCNSRIKRAIALGLVCFYVWWLMIGLLYNEA